MQTNPQIVILRSSKIIHTKLNCFLLQCREINDVIIVFKLCLMTSIVFIRPERMNTFHRLWYFEFTSVLKNYKLLKLLHFKKRIFYERQLRECQVDKIVKVLKIVRNCLQATSRRTF